MAIPGEHNTRLSQYTEFPITQEKVRKDREIVQCDIHYKSTIFGNQISRDSNVVWEAFRFLQDDGVPPNELWFVSGGKIVGKITGIGKEDTDDATIG